MNEIRIDAGDETRLKIQLQQKRDPESERMKRFLAMADLSRTPGSPLYEMVQRILAIPDFKNFDVIQIPEIVPVDVSFDLFDFAPDHPARSSSDTYYADQTNILRTHTTVMWYYHMQNAEVRKRMANGESVGAFSFGKVYRKDEIDKRHMNVFHQLDGWYLSPKEKQTIDENDLKNVLSDIAKAVFGTEVKCRFNQDTFPYTNPSLEMEIMVGNPPSPEGSGEARWVEVNGCGVVKGSVLEKFGVDSTRWTGWAFGLGLERLAILSMDLPDIRLFWSKDERVTKQLKLGHKFVEVSKFPPITRDISFVVDKSFIPNNYFDLIRDIGGDLVEQVELLDKFENEVKFGEGKISYTYRVVYRSPERTLKSEEVEPLQSKLYEQTKVQFNAELR